MAVAGSYSSSAALEEKVVYTRAAAREPGEVLAKNLLKMRPAM